MHFLHGSRLAALPRLAPAACGGRGRRTARLSLRPLLRSWRLPALPRAGACAAEEEEGYILTQL